MSIEVRDRANNGIRYLVKVRDGYGKPYPQRVFKQRVDAERYESELLRQREDGIKAQAKTVRALTVAQFIARWAEERRVNVSKGWKYSQDQMIKSYILPCIGGRRLLEIRPEHIGSVLKDMEDLGRGPQTRCHVFNLLHRIFGDAMGYYHLIAVNPATRRDKPALIRVEQEYLKPAEVKVLLAHVRDAYMGPAIWLAALAALRPNEIQALRVGAIDFEANLIRIKAGFKRKTGEIEPYPKGRRQGEVPMPSPLRELLIERCKAKAPSNFVVSGKRGEMLSYGCFIDHLHRHLAECQLPQISPHKLRHSATELWIQQGATEEDLIRLLNHSGAGAVRGYIHRSTDRLREFAAKIEVEAAEPVQRARLTLVR